MSYSPSSFKPPLDCHVCAVPSDTVKARELGSDEQAAASRMRSWMSDEAPKFAEEPLHRRGQGPSHPLWFSRSATDLTRLPTESGQMASALHLARFSALAAQP
ncbi:hypothetical protein E4U61_006121 [Claviceps capensis]|nr:hypothetical protein E4U61_006121 [Claviceps capensis]